MTNAEKFRNIFGIYATELWAFPEKRFLDWLNAEVPMTNADCIRAMTDEELATRLAHLTDCVWCPCPDPHDQCDAVDGGCKKQWLDWLKAEGGDAE